MFFDNHHRGRDSSILTLFHFLVEGGGGGFRLKLHIEVRIKLMCLPVWIFKAENFHSGRAQRKGLIPLHRQIYFSSTLTARFDIEVRMFVEGKIDGDTVSSPQFVAFEGASCEDSFSRVNLGQPMKSIDGESDKLDEQETLNAQRKD